MKKLCYKCEDNVFIFRYLFWGMLFFSLSLKFAIPEAQFAYEDMIFAFVFVELIIGLPAFFIMYIINKNKLKNIKAIKINRNKNGRNYYRMVEIY